MPKHALQKFVYLQINFAPFEVVKGVSGTNGTYEGYEVVTSLTIVTNINTYGPFGTPRGTAFSVEPRGDTEVVGFFGNSGDRLAAIGFYVRGSSPN